MNKVMLVAIATATLAFSFASTVSAQQQQQQQACGPNAVLACVCGPGSHCVADVAARHYPVVCAFGAVPNRHGGCSCPEEIRPRIARVSINLSAAYRRGLGLPLRGAVQACIDPLAAGGETGSGPDIVLSAVDSRVDILCGTAEGATAAQALQDCRDTRTLIESIRNLAPGSITIHYGDRNYTIQEFIDEVLVVKLSEIVTDLAELRRWREQDVDPTLLNHEGRITALEHRPLAAPVVAVPDGANSLTLRVGAEGRLGFMPGGPSTGALGATAGMFFRPNDANVDIYARATFGGQYTGMRVGESFYLSGGGGVSIYLGESRRDTTLQLGIFAEDLLSPGADTPGVDVMGSQLGFTFGGELAVEVPLGHSLFLRPALAVGYAERYRITRQMFDTMSGVNISPSIALEAQLW